MCGGCRNIPPSDVCDVCRPANGGECLMFCRDAFVYDKRTSNEEKAKRLKEVYVDGGNENGLKMGLVIPDELAKLL